MQPDMGLFLLKLVLTPSFIALATLVARRWGPVAGGWIVGLPLTSGPVSIFLFLEHGREFAVNAATGSLLGVISMVVYALAYSRASRRFPWVASALLAMFFFFLSTLVFSLVSPPLWAAAPLVIAANCAALRACGHASGSIGTAIPPPAWDIPFRMAAATGMVFAITTLSTHLGPKMSGQLSIFPVFICVMGIFAHTLSGPENVRFLMRGVILGAFSPVAFFFVVALAMRGFSAPLVYLLAALAAIGINGAVLALRAVCGKARRSPGHDSGPCPNVKESR